MDNNSVKRGALSQTSMPSFPTDPDYVPCNKFDPRYPWDPMIPSDEEMEADAKMEQDMILARKPREKLVSVLGEKGASPPVLKREIVRPVAPARPRGLSMKLAPAIGPGGERSSSSGTGGFSASALGGRSVPDVRGRDRYIPSPVSIPGIGSVSAPSMPARLPPLPSCPLGASAVASPAHIPPPMSNPAPPRTPDLTPEIVSQIPLIAKLLVEGHKLVDSGPVPVLEGKYISTADIPRTSTPPPVAPTAPTPIRGPSGDVGKPVCAPLTALPPQVLPNPTCGQAAGPTLSFPGRPPSQADEHAHVSNANSLSKPTHGREPNPPISSAAADHQLAEQREDGHRNREPSQPGRHRPEWAGVTIEAARATKGLLHPQAAAINSPHQHPPLAVDSGSPRRALGAESSGGSPVTRSRSRDGASGLILLADARPQQHRPNSLLEAHFPGDSSAQYCKEVRVAALSDPPRIPSEPRQQQSDNRVEGQAPDRRATPPRARSASPVALPAAPRSWNPGSEPNSLRVVYPHRHHPGGDTQEASGKATPTRPITTSDSQSTGARASPGGTQIGRDEWGCPLVSLAPAAAYRAQPLPDSVRSTSGSPPYSPPPGMPATPSAKSATPDRRSRMPSETPSYEPPETFVRSDQSTPSYHPPSEGYGHASPSPPPQPSGPNQNNRQPMQPPSRPDQSGPAPARSAPASDSGGMRVRGIASGIEARAQAQAQAQTSVRAQTPNYRGLEQRIGEVADNAVARLAASRARSRRPRTSRFTTKGRAPRARRH